MCTWTREGWGESLREHTRSCFPPGNLCSAWLHTCRNSTEAITNLGSFSQWLFTDLSRDINEFGEIQLASFFCLQEIQQTPCRRGGTAETFLNNLYICFPWCFSEYIKQICLILRIIWGTRIGVHWRIFHQESSQTAQIPLYFAQICSKLLDSHHLNCYKHEGQ